MKSQIVTITLCLLARLMVQAQTPNIDWGSTTKRGQSEDHNMIGSDGTNYWVLDYKLKATTGMGYVEMSLKKFGKNLNLEKEEELDTQIEGKDVLFNNAFISGDKIWIFFTTIDFQKGVKTLWAESFRLDNLQRIQKAYKVESKKFVLQSSTRPLFSVTSSPDHNQILIRSFKLNFQDIIKGQYTISENKITVLDPSLTFIWEKTIDYQSIFDLKINNQGTVIASASQKIGEDTRLGLLSLEAEGTDESFEEIEVEAKLWDQCFKVSFLDKNQAMAYLITQDKMLYIHNLDLSDKSLVWSDRFKLDFELEDEFENVRYKKDLDNIFDRVKLRFKAPIIAADGSIYLVGDTYTSYEGDDAVEGRIQGGPETYYGDILTIRLSATGELEWQKMLKKGQKLRGLYTRTKLANISFNAFLSPTQTLVFIYNDCPKNFKSPTQYDYGWLYTASKKDGVSMCEITPAGNVQYRLLYEYKTTAFEWVPNSFSETGENKYIMFGLSNKAFSLGRLTW